MTGVAVVPRLAPSKRTALFNDMFAPKMEVANPAKQGRGPWANAFQQIEQGAIDVYNQACGITEDTLRLQPDALQNQSVYQSPNTQARLRALASDGINVDKKRDEVNAQRRANAAALVQKILDDKPEEQILKPGLLSPTPYRQQRLQRACGLATFRMVFDAITGMKTEEEELRRFAHNEGLIDDARLQRTYATPAFRKRFGKEVVIRDIVGADLAGIGRLTTIAKSKGPRPFDDVYAILSLRRPGTERERTIWHSAVLLSADQHYVTVHDPKEIPNEYKPGRERPLPKDEFADLWSLSSNRVQLFLVRDLVQ